MKTKLIAWFLLIYITSVEAQTLSVTSATTPTQSSTLGGGNSTRFGYFSGTSLNSSGANNTFMGFESGRLNTSGNSNVFIGSGAGRHNVSSGQNVLIGYRAGYNSNSQWGGNVFVGSSAGHNVTNGSNNTFLGNSAGANTGSGQGNIFIGYRAGMHELGDNKLYIANTSTSSPLVWGDFQNNLLKLNSKVGVGAITAFPTNAGGVSVANYNLFVSGGILTEEVRVALNSTWADYVFEDTYRLPTLEEVEHHIKNKGHLINVPSAETIAQEGIALGEMAKIQQEKIEELTLYVIEQNKINLAQNDEIKSLKNELQELKKIIMQSSKK